MYATGSPENPRDPPATAGPPPSRFRNSRNGEQALTFLMSARTVARIRTSESDGTRTRELQRDRPALVSPCWPGLGGDSQRERGLSANVLRGSPGGSGGIRRPPGGCVRDGINVPRDEDLVLFGVGRSTSLSRGISSGLYRSRTIALTLALPLCASRRAQGADRAQPRARGARRCQSSGRSRRSGSPRRPHRARSSGRSPAGTCPYRRAP